MNLTLTLQIHCFVVALGIGLVAFVLHRRGLLSMRCAGVWVLFATFLYFFYNPASALLSGDTLLYEDALRRYPADGWWRPFWILGVIVAGLSVFFVAYLWRRPSERGGFARARPAAAGRWSLPVVFVLAALLAFAFYSLVFLRTRGQFSETVVKVEFAEGGKIVGGATGYAVVGHAFIVYVVALLLIRGPRVARWLGAGLLLGYVAVRLYDTHDRGSIVAMLAAVAMAMPVAAVVRWRSRVELLRRVRRSRLFVAVMLTAAFGMAVFLAVRGHQSIARMEDSSLERGQEALRRNDTAMLPVFYVESQIFEREGYDYGVPLVTKALFGWLPRQHFPWKDDLTTIVLGRAGPSLSPGEERWLRGAKSTVMGAFYGHGGAVGVLVGMLFLGVAARKLDGLVGNSRTDLGRALGIVWMANVWMMFASSDVYIMGNLFIYAMPFLALWLAAKVSNALPASQLAVSELARRRAGAAAVPAQSSGDPGNAKLRLHGTLRVGRG